MSDGDDPTIKQWLHFWLAIVLSALLVVFGSRVFLTTEVTVNSTLLMGVGLSLILGGALTMSTGLSSGGWRAAIILLALGFYWTARANGMIDMPWLAYIIGAFSWLAAGWLLYKTWPRRRPKNLGSMDGYDGFDNSV